MLETTLSGVIRLASDRASTLHCSKKTVAMNKQFAKEGFCLVSGRCTLALPAGPPQ